MVRIEKDDDDTRILEALLNDWPPALIKKAIRA